MYDMAALSVRAVKGSGASPPFGHTEPREEQGGPNGEGRRKVGGAEHAECE